ncbi:uncharacterized protein DSM5745_04107 [Aspergillus mulundensis]|uniref:Uncharacterized protein n=1 Tax=Aspergillus mulundensis TaxID=1810919 RepID=A0A3D8SC87_9EURO|nr:hypothetical protein DSM5745_04107 [Aspergillus mulundensis]RDW83781.1 hypothetical protein DSM5745_04107 [Aspergillus mulundensis]
MSTTNSVFDAIGLDLLGIPLAESFFPDVEPQYSILRVGAGLSQPGDSTASTGGSVPGVALFSPNGERVGFKAGSADEIIEEGNFKDIKIAPIKSQNTINIEYMSVVAGGDNALCIAYLALTPPSKDYWALYGDVPKSCGAAWYHSNLPIQLDGQPYKPACFWIGAPREDTGLPTNNFPMGIGLHTIDFDSNEALQIQYNEHPDTLCKSKPRLHMYAMLSEMSCLPIFDPPLPPRNGGGDEDFGDLFTQGEAKCEPSANDIDPFPWGDQQHRLQKWQQQGKDYKPSYGVKRRSVLSSNDNSDNYCTHPDELIESSYPGHTASELCRDPNAKGPDFVSHAEGLMCDMCTRTLWPLCRDEFEEDCFDVEAKQLRRQGQIDHEQWNITAHTKVAVGQARVYKKTTKWD